MASEKVFLGSSTGFKKMGFSFFFFEVEGFWVGDLKPSRFWFWRFLGKFCYGFFFWLKAFRDFFLEWAWMILGFLLSMLGF